MNKVLRDAFDCKANQELPTDLLGMQISKDKNGFPPVMKDYITRLKPLPSGANFKQFSGMRASLLWVRHCRPDISTFVSIIASVTADMFLPEHLALLKKKVEFLKATVDVGLPFTQLDAESLRLVTC